MPLINSSIGFIEKKIGNFVLPAPRGSLVYSTYPCLSDDLNLRYIEWLKEKYPTIICSLDKYLYARRLHRECRLPQRARRRVLSVPHLTLTLRLRIH